MFEYTFAILHQSVALRIEFHISKTENMEKLHATLRVSSAKQTL